MAIKGRRRPAHSQGRRILRKFILSAVLTIAAVLLTVVPALADNIGPGI
jgi:heme/copper-type cytochrome/quinol oxidase subunit 4